MKLSRQEVNRLIDAYWNAVEQDRLKLAEDIRQVIIGCCGIDVAMEDEL